MNNCQKFTNIVRAVGEWPHFKNFLTSFYVYAAIFHIAWISATGSVYGETFANYFGRVCVCLFCLWILFGSRNGFVSFFKSNFCLFSAFERFIAGIGKLVYRLFTFLPRKKNPFFPSVPYNVIFLFVCH